MIQLTYIFHDCFVLETPSATVVFDFYRDGDGEVEHPAFLSRLRRDVPVYLLVSHHHKDHFTREIFRWQKELPLMRFIISKDTRRAVNYLLKPGSIYAGDRPEPDSVTVLTPGEEYSDENIRVRAFASTDIGNSYFIDLDGHTFFHAGDLNAWVWKDESTPVEVAAAIRDFTNILDKIADACGTEIDLAMFPVDSRIGRDYWEGAKEFVRRFDVGLFIPMHFCLAEDAAEARRFIEASRDFDAYANPERGTYLSMADPGACIRFNSPDAASSRGKSLL